jgi:hypothetical protein
MGYHSVKLGKVMAAADTRIQLCHDHQKTVVWLQLTTPGTFVAGVPIKYSRHFIGAFQRNGRWLAMHDVEANRIAHVTLSYGTRFCDQKMQSRQQMPTERFQQAILADWSTFDGTNPSKWAKGTTAGADLSSPSFVMKALKTGFDAIGAAVHAYDGLQFRSFTVDDVIAYVNRRASSFINVVEDGLGDFLEVAPLPADDADQVDVMDVRAVPYIPSVKAHGGRFTYTEVDLAVPFPRVIGYGFRGESRAPGEVKIAGGFLANYTRPEHIALAQTRGSLQDQALDLPTFLNDQFFGGFISVSKSISVAKGFAIGAGGTTGRRGRYPGWIYACFVEGAFEIPPRGIIPPTANRPQIVVAKSELELAFPGMLDWEDIVACRWVNADGGFDGNVFMRGSLHREDEAAAGEILKLLSGLSQDPPRTS